MPRQVAQAPRGTQCLSFPSLSEGKQHPGVSCPPHHPHNLVWKQEEDEENLYSSIQQLRDRASELSSQVSSYERTNGCDFRYQQRLDELRAAQERLMELTEVRNRK